MSNHDDRPKLSASLRTALTQVFALGFLDERKGSPIIDEDEVDGATASEIGVAALECLEEREVEIHRIYSENPGRVFDQIYHQGREAYRRESIA